eukprot:gene5153-3703_t
MEASLNNNKLQRWSEEQESIQCRARVPRTELYTLEGNDRLMPPLHEGKEFDLAFCHDSFELPAEALLSLQTNNKVVDAQFMAQIEHDVKRNLEAAKTHVLPPLHYVGGLDISFFPEGLRGVATLVVLEYPSLEEVRCIMEECSLTEDYAVGFLAFREAPHFLRLFRKWGPELLAAGIYPQLVVVDGCGTHHPRRAGLATHLGVLLGVPTIGCAKNMLMVDGVTSEEVLASLEHQSRQIAHDRVLEGSKSSVNDIAPLYPIVGHSSPHLLYGYAVMTSSSPKKAIFISPGHQMGFAISVALLLTMRTHRIPEPTRLADLKSREFIRHSLHAAQESAAVHK